MKTVFRQTQLYKFLLFCSNDNLPNDILDCGAGGDCPPLALFRSHGYNVQGIEISEKQIDIANKYATKYGLDLNISKANMLQIPFESDSFSYVYSYNSIFHMCKNDIQNAVLEIERVLRPGGLCFINFLSLNDFRHGCGEKVGEGEFLQEERDDIVLHSYFQDNEADKYFEGMEILIKENRILERINDGKSIMQGYIDYIVRKGS